MVNVSALLTHPSATGRSNSWATPGCHQQLLGAAVGGLSAFQTHKHPDAALKNVQMQHSGPDLSGLRRLAASAQGQIHHSEEAKLQGENHRVWQD